MQIGRLEFGIWKKPKPMTIRRRLEMPKQKFFEYDKGACGCRILTIGRVYIAWLGDICYDYWKNDDIK